MAAGKICPGFESFFLMAGLGSPQTLASVDWASFADASIPSACSYDVHQSIILPKDLFMNLLPARSGYLQCNFLIAALEYLSQTSEGFWEQHLSQIAFTLCFKARLLLGDSSSCMVSSIGRSISPVRNKE